MNTKYHTLATLGDPPHNELTSSFHVAEQLGLAETVIGCASFEEAIATMLRGDADVAMVAGAYPKISDFIMDSDIKCVRAFVEQIPPLVAVGPHHEPPKTVATVYLPPAMIPLLSKLEVTYDHTIETAATSAAAARTAEDQDSVAICNLLAASFYDLTVYQTLQPSARMPFVLFSRP